MKTIPRRTLAAGSLLTVGALALAGCGGGPGSGGSDGESGAADGNVVTVYGTISDTEADLLEQSWADWEEENDIDIQYEASKEFEAQIAVRAQGGNAPDIAIFPQPGLMGDMADLGYLKPAPQEVADNVAEYWSEDWAKYGTYDGTLYGAPLMASVKGWVWYSPSFFEENGYEVPTDWQGLVDLTAQIQGDTGSAPWCVGFGSDAATGWPGTDWVEDVVLRQAGPEVYDQWVTNEVPFTDPQIASAFDEVGKILKNPDYVNAGFGGTDTIVTTPFGDPASALVSGECVLHHQASFYDGFITDAGGTVAEDGDIWAFLTPAFGDAAGDGAVVTGGGEIVAAFSDDEATQKVQAYLSSPEWANSRVSLGGVISANKGLDPENASSEILKEAIAILQDEGTTFRFDASDLMPSGVGTNTFFKGMNDWVNGSDTATVLEQIESGWPSS
ncbi:MULTISPECIES: ABC transporter substrate-binding protein [Microbacterium]|uniref:ABC transporter substrate-binding protein n=1 Tax=Microbacterium TaxID=33882 RepID=UPI00214BF5F6|nr:MULTISPECIES: ABC transporter substrate-binding protein [unclassified Microbacterium]MCR2812627.1 ABC transporter substrate-binding protein [Microbacterium sp. zg.Y1084]MDL5485780.1 ABC transporter substrate-binding protein [Microbacterium sp. zg-Y1211]